MKLVNWTISTISLRSSFHSEIVVGKKIIIPYGYRLLVSILTVDMLE